MKYDRITVDPAVMVGKPCISGTRIAMDLILRKLAAGKTQADLLLGYPHLSREDVRQALAFAADFLTDGDIELAMPR
ncbi:MAG: DUF433 domain-containing protein [Alphaproteobacteria bacterium]|nr:DUF433 domain-containing protein [Alphaproteobacteria bacterium]MCW5744370.1 DUF433 domain-containing protein [Alphaproteobacteria bacterium]